MTKKVIKKIGKIFLFTILVGELFLLIPFAVHYTESMLSGSSAIDSISYAHGMVEQKIIKPVNEWFEKGETAKYWKPSFENDLSRYEIPMENWNINWNSLNKKDP